VSCQIYIERHNRLALTQHRLANARRRKKVTDRPKVRKFYRTYHRLTVAMTTVVAEDQHVLKDHTAKLLHYSCNSR